MWVKCEAGFSGKDVIIVRMGWRMVAVAALMPGLLWAGERRVAVRPVVKALIGRVGDVGDLLARRDGKMVDMAASRFGSAYCLELELTVFPRSPRRVVGQGKLESATVGLAYDLASDAERVGYVISAWDRASEDWRIIDEKKWENGPGQWAMALHNPERYVNLQERGETRLKVRCLSAEPFVLKGDAAGIGCRWQRRKVLDSHQQALTQAEQGPEVRVRVVPPSQQTTTRSSAVDRIRGDFESH